jgi:hypothetical protein
MTKARDIASAAPAPAGVTATELGYVDGVTSAIQTQVDAKIAKTLTTTTGDIIYASGANTPARLGIGSSAQVLTVSGGVPAWTTPTTSASGLTLVGQSTFTSSTSVIFNNVFSSTYQNYLVVGRITGGATSLAIRLRVGGTNATASNYTYQSFTSSGTSNTSARATGAPVFYGPAVSAGDITTFTYAFFSPFEAAITGVELRGQFRTNSATNEFNINTGAHTLATSYDGFEFYNSGTSDFTGSIRVYGYQNS